MNLSSVMCPVIATLFLLLINSATQTDVDIHRKNNYGENRNFLRHTSKIQKRSIFRILRLKQSYKPLQISINWVQSNENGIRRNKYGSNRRNAKTYQTRRLETIPFNPARKLTTPIPSTGQATYVIKPRPPPNLNTTLSISTTQLTDDTYEKDRLADIESTTQLYQMKNLPTSQPSIRPIESTTQLYQMKNLPTGQPSIRPIESTTQLYQMMNLPTGQPSIRPISKIVNYVPRTDITLGETTNYLSNGKSVTGGGFTSTSKPQLNQYSELIYDIDPRYRIR